MKISRTHIAAGFTRGAVLIALSLGLSAAAANAAENVTVSLAGKSFGVDSGGNSVNLSADSVDLVDAAPAYYYRVTGTCHGTGNYQSFVPQGTDIKDLINQIKTGGAKSLTGTTQNPGGTLPVDPLYNQTYTGDVDSGGVTAHISATLFAKIAANGQVTFEIKNVSVTVFGSSQPGTIEFEQGAEIAVGVAPVIEMAKGAKSFSEAAGGNADLVVIRTGNLGVAVDVHYAAKPGTATKADYALKAGILHFAKGDGSQKITTLRIKEDTIKEGDEKFSVVLSKPVAAVLGNLTKTVVTVLDNE